MIRFSQPSRLVAGAAVLLFILCSGLPQMAQSQITADRPGFGVAAPTVAEGTFQAGVGYAYNGNGITSQELGQLLLRYGVSNTLELRGGINSFVVFESPIDNGYVGTSVGAKVRLVENETSTLSGLASVALPTGTGPFDTADDRARQELRLAFDGMLGEGLTVSINGGTRFFYSAGVQDDRFVEWLFIPTLSFDVTESAAAYVGYAGFYTDVANQNWVEGGLTIQSNPNTQFDVNTGLRIDDNADAFFLGVGVAHRF